MLDLKSVLIRNFMSWGNYDTIVDLSEMEECFITGNILDSDNPDTNSNGAGKSSLTQAVLWCLSGRTMYDSKGNDVLCWFSDGDCYVSLTFKNGDVLTRIRTRSGDTELILQRGGDDVIRSTLSTNTNQQRALDRELKFDFDIFTRSMFFNQYKRPWLEMGDQSRKQILERIMGIDRLSIYASIAKEKRDRVDREQEKTRTQLEGIKHTADKLREQQEQALELSEKFQAKQLEQRNAKIEEAEEYEAEAEDCEQINVAKLKKKWAIIDKIKEKSAGLTVKMRSLEDEKASLERKRATLHNALERTCTNLDSGHNKKVRTLEEDHRKERRVSVELADREIERARDTQNQDKERLASASGKLANLTALVDKWEGKRGGICLECEQQVKHDHVDSKLGPLNSDIDNHKNEVDRCTGAIQASEAEISNIKSKKALKCKEIDDELEAQKKQAKAELEVAKEAATDECQRMHAEVDARIEEINAEIESTKASVNAIDDKIAENKPEFTVAEAEAKNGQKSTLVEAANKAREEAGRVLQEPNLHKKVIDSLAEDILAEEAKAEKAERDLKGFDLIYKHYNYIYRAYSDRRKIKSFLIGKHRPYFNSRLNHYLETFGLDVRISLTDSLALTSNLWGYNMQSGGERCRTDISFMFAVFDLHEGIHGRQCNILVLDEPDKGLDASGVQALISIIKNNLAVRFESIFIISHNKCFRDVFPRQLVVERSDRFSLLADAR